MMQRLTFTLLLAMFLLLNSAAGTGVAAEESSSALDAVRSSIEAWVQELSALRESPSLQAAVVSASVPQSAEEESDAEVWAKAKTLDEPVRTLLVSPCSLQLQEFQANHPVFIELLLTDSNGRVRCLTRKSDLLNYEHETWWRQTIAAAQPFVEEVEERRSGAAGIAISEVVRSASGVRGVLRAVVDLSSLDGADLKSGQ